MATETEVPFRFVALIVGAALTLCVAMALRAPEPGAPLIDHIQWLSVTAIMGTVIVFGLTWIFYKVYDL